MNIIILVDVIIARFVVAVVEINAVKCTQMFDFVAFITRQS